MSFQVPKLAPPHRYHLPLPSTVSINGDGSRFPDLGHCEEEQLLPDQTVCNGNGNVQFSKEPNNLYNVHSFKHSGLANKKNVTVQPASSKELAVVLSTTKTKKQNKPASLYHKSVMRKEFRKMAKAVKNQVGNNYYRPDLTKPALARLSSVYRSLQVAKSGVKKKNRQAN